MAIYVYKCKTKGCGYIGEYLVPIGTSLDLDCPDCIKRGVISKLAKAVTAPNIISGSQQEDAQPANSRVIIQDLPYGCRRVQHENQESKSAGIVRKCGGGVVFVFGEAKNPEHAGRIMRRAEKEITDALK
ncbi:zinc ribbon domain-containing protein [Candidatus Pacearchaeota archaeon]|nr:zinc ribbon domain-containing protein [Candidatus Pacearchaeota archaeon]